MIALGWTLATSWAPAPMTVHPDGDLGVVTICAGLAPNPRARLAHQTTFIEEGMPLLPLRPGMPLTEKQALALSRTHGAVLRHTLLAQRGFTQLSVYLAWPAPEPAAAKSVTGPFSGRDWLADRQNHHAQLAAKQAAAARLLSNLTGLIEVQDTRLDHSPGHCVAHVLLPFSTLSEAKQALAAGWRGQSDSTFRLTVTGPWPPLAFTPVLTPPAKEAA